MDEIFEQLKQHAKRYPKAQPEDFIKLLYQNEFGPEHAIEDSEQMLANLIRESYETEGQESELFVPIGNHLVRLNIHVAMKEYDLEEINGWFIRTGKTHRGSMASFLEKIKVFEKSFSKISYHFTKKALEEYLSYYRSKAYPSVHHSELYQELYKPHYRVVQENIWK